MKAIDVDAAIMIVDDAQLPCVTIHRALSAVGYHDIRTCNSASDALDMIDVRPADVVLADWCMPEMDGLEMTKHIRQKDEELGRYTGVIVITALDREDAVAHALASDADDFVYKSPNQIELLARVANAARISRLQNTVLQTMKVFAKQNRDLIDKSAFDPDSGAYVRSFFEDRLTKSIENVSSRNGAVVCMAMRLLDAESYPSELYEELFSGVFQRLQQLVRPIDEIARIEKDIFGIQVHYLDETEYHPSSYTRLLNQLNLREIKTKKGFHKIECVLSQCVYMGNEATTPTAAGMLTQAQAGLASAAETKTIQSAKWLPEDS